MPRADPGLPYIAPPPFAQGSPSLLAQGSPPPVPGLTSSRWLWPSASNLGHSSQTSPPTTSSDASDRDLLHALRWRCLCHIIHHGRTPWPRGPACAHRRRPLARGRLPPPFSPSARRSAELGGVWGGRGRW
ncbi:hypothetical protein ACQJBY_007178 [Aegilops geniculata]